MRGKSIPDFNFIALKNSLNAILFTLPLCELLSSASKYLMRLLQ